MEPTVEQILKKMGIDPDRMEGRELTKSQEQGKEAMRKAREIADKYKP